MKFQKPLAGLVLVCFAVYALAGSATASAAHAFRLSAESAGSSEIDDARNSFLDAQILRQVLHEHASGNLMVSRQEVEQIRQTVALRLENCFAVLNSRLEDRHLLDRLQSRVDCSGAEAVLMALHTIRALVGAPAFSEKNISAGIGSTTIIGIPYGIPVYVLSWILYFIALEFEDVQPEIGLILFYVSGILSYLGLYFIL
jgi:hypothetical protein